MADNSTDGLKHRINSNTISEKEEENVETKEDVPTIKRSTSEDFTQYISEMNPRWKSWWIRTIFTLLMIGGFLAVILMGPLALLLLVLVIHTKCYHEIISIGHQHYKKYNLPLFRTLSWYFLGVTNYFFYGEITAEYFAEFLQQEEMVTFLLQRHRLISFLLYTIGIMLFVLSLKKNYYKVQFALFGWYQLTLLIVLTPSHLIIQNMLTGLIWFFLPISMVICNDIWAYIFGFFFGKTRLIKLSPKKTWEGFIGGYFATVIYGLVACQLMCEYEYFHCPLNFNATTLNFDLKCSPSPTFQLTHYVTINPTIHQLYQALPTIIRNGMTTIMALCGFHLQSNNTEVWLYPMVLHGMLLACFSSLIAPFGGFFASGFKRAFKMKDFADTIPGHGGIMDRFDCQLLMGVFVNVYIASMIRAYNPGRLIQQVMFMEKSDQVLFYQNLKDILTTKGLIQ